MNIAIVTGASHGLGEALAAALLAEGFRVIGLARSATVRLAHPALEWIPCDLADVASLPAHVATPFANAAASRPAFACLVNNAATPAPTGIAGELDDSEIARAITVNLTAPFVLANAFCRAFADPAVRRRIINVSSGAAHTAFPGAAAYCTSKAGLEMLTRALAADKGSPTFDAISLRPGIIDTPMQTFMRAQPQEKLPGVAMFQGFHAEGKLVAPDTVAARVVAKLILNGVESGRTYSYAEL